MGRSVYFQPEPEYRKNPGESQSNLKAILRSPAHYQVAKSRKFSPPPVMEMGTAVHCRVLEGDEEFEKRYVKKPEGLSLSTKAGKEWKAEQGGRIPLSTTDQYQSWDAVQGMTDSLRRLEWFSPDLWDEYYKHNEVSIYWHQQSIDCKARLDRLLLLSDRAVVVDVKTTDDVHPSVFRKKIFGGLNYLFQAGWYTEGTAAVYDLPTEFVFVAVSRNPPYGVISATLEADAIEEAYRQTSEARLRLRRCLDTGDWSPPGIDSITMGLPSYYMSPIDAADRETYNEDIESAFSIPDDL